MSDTQSGNQDDVPFYLRKTVTTPYGQMRVWGDEEYRSAAQMKLTLIAVFAGLIAAISVASMICVIILAVDYAHAVSAVSSSFGG